MTRRLTIVNFKTISSWIETNMTRDKSLSIMTIMADNHGMFLKHCSREYEGVLKLGRLFVDKHGVV